MQLDYSKLPHHQVLCIDMKSFYASVEAVNRGLDPLKTYLVVVGDKTRPGSVVLAASPKMKEHYKIKTGNRLYEVPKDPRIHVVNARMGFYLDNSMTITKLLNNYAPVEAISVYSVDESWLTADGLEHLYGDVHQIAARIRTDIQMQLGLPCAIGIGPNKLLAKLVLDNYAKKSGIAECRYEDVPRLLWPLPVEDIWGIGNRMKRNLNRMGIYKLGDLAHYSLQRLKSRFGVMGEQLYYHAWGVDLSPVFADPSSEVRKGFSNGITLMRDYSLEETNVVVYELADHIASRLRKFGMAARTISISIGYSKNESIGGFSHSLTLHEATNISKRIYEACLSLIHKYAQNYLVRTIHVGVTNLLPDDQIQVDLFTGPEDEKLRKLGTAIDKIHHRFGADSLFRACSLTDAGTSKSRAHKIGGHAE